MDFILGIGERDFIGKANAVPGRLENFANNQFKDSTNPEKQVREASKLPFGGKGQEIAKLREELALAKLEKGKASGEAKYMRASKSSKAPEEGRALKADGFDGKRSPTTPKEKWRESGVTDLDPPKRKRLSKHRPRSSKAANEVAAMDSVGGRRSLDHSGRQHDSRTAIMPAARKPAPGLPVHGRSSVDLIRSPRHSPEELRPASGDLGRGDYYLVEVTEAGPRRKKKYHTIEV